MAGGTPGPSRLPFKPGISSPDRQKTTDGAIAEIQDDIKGIRDKLSGSISQLGSQTSGI